MKILIVDDNIPRSTGLKQHLVEFGHDSIEVSTTDCADGARRILQERYYDVLVLDVVLPKRAGETPDASYGLSLLDQLDSPLLNKPEKIIGITAYSEDLGKFRSHFEENCNTVVEASPGDASWREKITRSIGYTRSSKIVRGSSNVATTVVTVHGIRTYGSWQSRLTDMIRQHTDKVAHYDYKYDYFSALKLLVPHFREKEVLKLEQSLSVFDDYDPQQHLLIFAHSFGTYIVVELIRRLVANGHTIPRTTLVLCGSVLPVNYDWRFLPNQATLVNECGDSDFPLLLATAFAPGFGMAGRCGFSGFNRRSFVNRYFRGGHSLYFSNDFMSGKWIPLLENSQPDCVPLDERDSPSMASTLIEGAVRAACRVKNFFFQSG